MNSREEVFNPTHWQDIELRAWERENINYESVLAVSSYGQLFTMIVDDKILAIVGYWQKWEGVFEVYVYPSIHVKDYPVFYVRRIRRYLKQIAQTFRMRRQQTISLADDETDKWMKAVGFECEGTLKAFTRGGEDCRMWVRFNEVEL